MPIQAKYAHTNLTRPPERDLSGSWLEELTAVPRAHVTGIHLALPGFGDDGPTLEIFSYEGMNAAALPVVNEPGFGHIAFQVEDVEAAVEAVKAHGGDLVGQVATTEIRGVGLLKVAYARDPDGNIVELQNWR